MARMAIRNAKAMQAKRATLSAKAEPDEGATSGKSKPKSKKHVVPKLPKLWREDLFAHKHAEVKARREQADEDGLPDPKFGVLLPMAIAHVSGCRPDEIETGVKVWKRNDMLMLEIEGSKLAKDEEQNVVRSIEVRILEINPKSSNAAEFLMNEIATERRRTVKYLKKTFSKMFNDAVANFTKYNEKFTKKEYTAAQRRAFSEVSPYVYRHALAYDMLSCTTMSPVEASAILGHHSIESISSYGRVRKSKSAVRPVSQVGIKGTVIDPGQRDSDGKPVVLMNSKGSTAEGVAYRRVTATSRKATAKPSTPGM
jgi:integrase